MIQIISSLIDCVVAALDAVTGSKGYKVPMRGDARQDFRAIAGDFKTVGNDMSRAYARSFGGHVKTH